MPNLSGSQSLGNSRSLQASQEDDKGKDHYFSMIMTSQLLQVDRSPVNYIYFNVWNIYYKISTLLNTFNKGTQPSGKFNRSIWSWAAENLILYVYIDWHTHTYIWFTKLHIFVKVKSCKIFLFFSSSISHLKVLSSQVHVNYYSQLIRHITVSEKIITNSVQRKYYQMYILFLEKSTRVSFLMLEVLGVN